jgi:hypothetical protein
MLALAASLAAAFPATGAFAQDGGEHGMSYESLRHLPDLAGGWVPAAFPFDQEATPSGRSPVPPQVRPEAAERARAFRESVLSGGGVERGYCAPAAFAGRLPMNGGGALEILFNPGRITIAVESGLVRRIYLRPTDMLEESRGGSSIGRWEGASLVVETKGMSRAASFLPGVPLGGGARSVERFSLRDPDTLQVETTLTAPDVLTAPLTSTLVYRRARDRVFTEFDICVMDDRSFDDASQQERFDATPPADLPPPPAG